MSEDLMEPSGRVIWWLGLRVGSPERGPQFCWEWSSPYSFLGFPVFLCDAIKPSHL